MADKIVTIHQPDFFPWMGFFNKIKNANIWVVLDHVKNNPRDASFWGRRVKMIINKQAQWVSVPLVKPKQKHVIGVAIQDMRINTLLQKPVLNTKISIEQSYKKAPFFNDVFPFIDAFFSENDSSLENRNMNFITEVMKALGINTTVVFSKDLDCKKSSTELLVEIVNKLHGDIYLAGAGAGGYQIDELFVDNGIELRYNNFCHPIYYQYNLTEFIPELSVVDALMNIGFDGVKNIL